MQKCAPQIFQENEHYYYYCNRAGNFNPRGKGERGLKSQGSSKIISHCSAHIKAIKNIKTNEVTVQYTCTHYNHQTQLGHLRISNPTRMVIADK